MVIALVHLQMLALTLHFQPDTDLIGKLSILSSYTTQHYNILKHHISPFTLDVVDHRLR